MCQSLEDGGIRCIADTKKTYFKTLLVNGDNPKTQKALAKYDEAIRFSLDEIKEQKRIGNELIKSGKVAEGVKEVAEADKRLKEREAKSEENEVKFVIQSLQTLQKKEDARVGDNKRWFDDHEYSTSDVVGSCLDDRGRSLRGFACVTGYNYREDGKLHISMEYTPSSEYDGSVWEESGDPECIGVNEALSEYEDEAPTYEQAAAIATSLNETAEAYVFAYQVQNHDEGDAVQNEIITSLASYIHDGDQNPDSIYQVDKSVEFHISQRPFELINSEDVIYQWESTHEQ